MIPIRGADDPEGRGHGRRRIRRQHQQPARGPVALLCGCADPQRCHRALAADFLAGRLGAPVVHLFAPPRAPRDDGGQLTLPGL